MTTHDNVMVVAVVKTGVTPLPLLMFGVTVPDQRMGLAPATGLARGEIGHDPVPPEPAGNVMLETGEQFAGPTPVTVHPPTVRATLARE